MSRTLNRDAAVRYADEFWSVPCRDGRVWLHNNPIDIATERAKRRLDSSWKAVFLEHESNRRIDHLYFVTEEVYDSRQQYDYLADSVPDSDKVLIQTWAGLNDCAHFVSECLKAGGIPVSSLKVGPLVDQLKARSDTKTLASLVPLVAAVRIVESGIMRPGDVIAFGTCEGYGVHAHSTVYLGENMVANHTRFNHSSYSGPDGGSGDNGRDGNWKIYADEDRLHPFVTLIHFGHDDPVASSPHWIEGWWRMEFPVGRAYWCYFARGGRVQRFDREPTNTKTSPLAAPTAKGYWFTDSEAVGEVRVCWTGSGNFEEFRRSLFFDANLPYGLASKPLILGNVNGLLNAIRGVRI